MSDFPNRKSPIEIREFLARDFFQHLRVRREFLHEHEQTLNRLFGFVAGESAPDEIDFLELPRLEKQFLTPSSGKENVDRGINALIADFSVEHHLHVTSALKFLEDELVHAAAGFDQSSRDNRQ